MMVRGSNWLPSPLNGEDQAFRDKTRQDKTRQDKARQGKTRQGKTRQGKTRQDKTRQEKTRQDQKKKPEPLTLLAGLPDRTPKKRKAKESPVYAIKSAPVSSVSDLVSEI
jgi:hypothetical protein